MNPAMESGIDSAACSAEADGLASRSQRFLCLDLLVTFLILLLFSWLGIDLSHHSEGVATIWFSNGLLFAIVIRKPQSVWIRYFLVGLAADTLADVLFGDRLALAFGVSIANSVEVILSSVLLTYWFGAPFNLARRRQLVAFLGIAVVGVTALTSALGASWTLLFVPVGPWWQLFRTWYLGDILGMALIAPLAFILQRPGFFAVLHRRQLPETLLTLTIPALAAALVFSHNNDPLLFAIFPALLFVIFRLGFPGAVLATVVIACISISFTVSGHGPLMLIQNTNMLHRIVIAQVFLAIALFTGFIVAALLEEQKTLELSLQQREAQYRELAHTDALTGQGNRRAFDERLKLEWQRSDVPEKPLALLSIDVDLFKSYNDIYGHIAGDECLRRIATVAADNLPNCRSARLFRLGGEEFAVILPCTNTETAFQVAERIRQAVFHLSIEHPGSPLGVQTISNGVATAFPNPHASPLSLLALSDQALYQAKSLGRNRSETARESLAASTISA